jgi:hypothetical protein
MPNWCNNSFTVSHEDPEMIAKFVAGVREGNLFETLIPLSCGDWDYNIACLEWGTKWDVSSGDAVISDDGKSATGWFDTAWNPPINAFYRLDELGFDIDVLYHEPGMAFAGHYTTETDDVCVEYDFSNPEWREDIINKQLVTDPELLDLLDEEYNNYLEWNEETE